MFKYTALIIEPREHKAFSFVINNFLCNLSNEWGILIFHGTKNGEYVKNIVDQLDETYKNRIINVINLQVDNLNHMTYSDFFLTKTFYDHIPTDTFLVFQTDSMILQENKDLIHSFLDYDYVGGPWVCDNRVGNGGLSIRNKNKMLEIIDSKGYINMNEDIYFSHDIDININYNVPDCSIAKMFSVETLFYDKPFGVHNCWMYLHKDNIDFLTNKYPEIKELIELQ